jgi:hypothetical protein
MVRQGCHISGGSPETDIGTSVAAMHVFFRQRTSAGDSWNSAYELASRNAAGRHRRPRHLPPRSPVFFLRHAGCQLVDPTAGEQLSQSWMHFFLQAMSKRRGRSGESSLSRKSDCPRCVPVEHRVGCSHSLMSMNYSAAQSGSLLASAPRRLVTCIITGAPVMGGAEGFLLNSRIQVFRAECPIINQGKNGQ